MLSDELAKPNNVSETIISARASPFSTRKGSAEADGGSKRPTTQTAIRISFLIGIMEEANSDPGPAPAVSTRESVIEMQADHARRN